MVRNTRVLRVTCWGPQPPGLDRLFPQLGMRRPAPEWRNSGVSDEEAAVFHDEPAVYRDVGVGSQHIDVRRAVPVGTGFVAGWVPKGDVHARKFLVLEKVADDLRESDVGANRKFARPVGVGMLGRVLADVG